jgi:hypothetical protein
MRRGERKRLAYQNTQRRRVNAIAVRITAGAAPALHWQTARTSFTATDVVTFLLALPKLARPLIIVLDNAGIHRSKTVQAAKPALWARGIYLYYLPPYSPELNPLEHDFRHIKHHELPERCYATLVALEGAIHAAFTTHHQWLQTKHFHQPRLAA